MIIYNNINNNKFKYKINNKIMSFLNNKGIKTLKNYLKELK